MTSVLQLSSLTAKTPSPTRFTLKAPITTIVVCFCLLPVTLKVIVANSVDPDQTVPLEQSDLGPHCLPICKM